MGRRFSGGVNHRVTNPAFGRRTNRFPEAGNQRPTPPSGRGTVCAREGYCLTGRLLGAHLAMAAHRDKRPTTATGSETVPEALLFHPSIHCVSLCFIVIITLFCKIITIASIISNNLLPLLLLLLLLFPLAGQIQMSVLERLFHSLVIQTAIIIHLSILDTLIHVSILGRPAGVRRPL